MEGGREGETEREERRRKTERQKNPYYINNICSFCYLREPHSS